MSFEVDSYSSAWAHIALCADLTWTSGPPDDFVIANQRLWAQHCRISQIFQDTTETQNDQNIQCDLKDQHQSQKQNSENGNIGNSKRSVRDVIPDSKLAQYGNFYYDENREKCYTNSYEKPSHSRGYSYQDNDNCSITECWMLPEVDYWYRKLLEDSPDGATAPRRRRQNRMLNDYDFGSLDADAAHNAGEEAALAARVLSVRPLWANRASKTTPAPRIPSPPQAPRKIRARRRQPRRLVTLAPTPPNYHLDAQAQLLCDPSCKFQFDSPRQQQLSACQKSRLSASMQAAMRSTVARYPPYRGTNVSRYAPTTQRPARCPDRRYGVWWPRDHPSPRLDHKLLLTHLQHNKSAETDTKRQTIVKSSKIEMVESKPDAEESEEIIENKERSESKVVNLLEKDDDASLVKTENSDKQDDSNNISIDKGIEGEKVVTTNTSPVVTDNDQCKKRLYSTVLSMSAPPTVSISQMGCVRLQQKLITPGLLKLNPKIVLPSARLRPPNVDNKFEELEKEALEQYKASDESIDTKFHELEKQAVEQYSTSNSNTSCSSGNSADKRSASSPSVPENDQNKKQSLKFHKEKSVDSVVIYSQNFPEFSTKGQTSSAMNLKNLHTPPRGEKKEQPHRPIKISRSVKNDSQRAASDTDDARETNLKGHKGPMRWTLHVPPPKKRHLSSCATDLSSDDDIDEPSGAIKDAGPCSKNLVSGKIKMSAHGGGDLHPILRKT